MDADAGSPGTALIAKAMASPPPSETARTAMIAARLSGVAQAKRDELLDPAFGDRELEWWSADEPSVLLARGYSGHEANFDLRDGADEVIVSWDGDVASALLSLGQPGQREYNV